MSAKTPAELSPAAIARSDRKRLAAEEGMRAMADVEKHAIDIRQNMARLRQVREARDAAEAALQPVPRPPAKKRSRKAAASSSPH